MKIKSTHTIVVLSCVALATPSYGQHLQVAGISGSIHVARLHTGQQEFAMGQIAVDPQADQSNDETGNGVTAFGRWQVGKAGWYVQPEIGYASTLATPVGLTYNLAGSSFSGPYAGRRIRHVDARLLGGYQSGPLRLFAGPSVSRFLGKSTATAFSTNPVVQEAAAALDSRPSTIQVAIQAGAGISIWRLDLNARYEWGLTPYSQTIRFQQQTYYFNRKLQQLIVEVGFQLYKRPLQGY
jgi:hypothetical protein